MMESLVLLSAPILSEAIGDPEETLAAAATSSVQRKKPPVLFDQYLWIYSGG